MSDITIDSSISTIPEFAPFAPYLMYGANLDGRPAEELTFAKLHVIIPAWSDDAMVRGAKRLAEVAKSGHQVMHDVYAAEECVDDPEKTHVKLLHLPPVGGSYEKPFVIGVAGGAFSAVGTLVESLPTAARLNELGYHAFLLNYRLDGGSLPKAEEDLAASVRYVLAHAQELGISNTEYVVNGYSAGGTVATVFGTERNGWAKFSVPTPKALFAMYPAPSFAPELMDPTTRDWFLAAAFGEAKSEEVATAYDVIANLTPAFPPCYLGASEDDATVPVEQTKAFAAALESVGISVVAEIVPTGDHGWGDGTGTPAAGWPDRADAWLTQELPRFSAKPTASIVV